MIDPVNRAVFGAKNKWAIKQWEDIDEYLIYIANWKKPIWKCFICIIPTVWHPGKGQPLETVRRSVAARVLEWLWGRAGHSENRIF